MMSKDKILKGIGQQIADYSYSVVDYELSGEAPPDYVSELKTKVVRLKEIYEELEKLLM
jgi:hypothetical protein